MKLGRELRASHVSLPCVAMYCLVSRFSSDSSSWMGVQPDLRSTIRQMQLGSIVIAAEPIAESFGQYSDRPLPQVPEQRFKQIAPGSLIPLPAFVFRLSQLSLSFFDLSRSLDPISQGYLHTCALDYSQEAVCWGQKCLDRTKQKLSIDNIDWQ